MRRAAFLLLPLSFLGLACYAQNIPVIDPAEALNPQEITFDFGKVKAPEVAAHTFVIKNEYGKELNIRDVTTSCGCTGSQIKKKKLAPGESTELSVSFNSKGYSGAVKQFVYVHTDNFALHEAVPGGRGGNAAAAQVALRVDGKPIRGLDNTILRFIIKSEVEPRTQASTP